mgnify:CR=1 FL=1
MGKWKAIIEAGKGYSKRTAKQGSESLTQGTKDINDLYKPFDKTNEVKKEITDGVKKQGIDTEFTKDIQKEVTNIKKKVTDNIDDLTGPIKRNL